MSARSRRKRERSFIWSRPLRERAFPRRFWLLSALIHLAAFGFLRSDAFDLAGRGDTPSPSTRSSHARSPMPSRSALQVVALTVESSEREPEPEARSPRREPLDVERILETIGAELPAVTSAAASAPPAPGGRGGAFTPPVPLAFRWPEYPEDAPRTDGPVTVVVRVRVGTSGEVTRAEIERSAGAEVLDRRALDVARGMRFSPARREGRPVTAWFSLPVTFHP